MGLGPCRVPAPPRIAEPSWEFSTTLELIRSADSQAPPGTWVEPQNLCFHKLLMCSAGKFMSEGPPKPSLTKVLEKQRACREQPRQPPGSATHRGFQEAGSGRPSCFSQPPSLLLWSSARGLFFLIAAGAVARGWWRHTVPPQTALTLDLSWDQTVRVQGAQWAPSAHPGAVTVIAATAAVGVTTAPPPPPRHAAPAVFLHPQQCRVWPE